MKREPVISFVSFTALILEKISPESFTLNNVITVLPPGIGILI